MKLVILSGGKGTRISEESILKPKPLVEIGNMPIIWHIMKIYSFYGINEFIICCGYKGYLIKEYFANYSLHSSDVTIDINKNTIDVHRKSSEDWRITLVDTGEETLTGGRILRIKNYIKDDFLLTYGDGVSDVNIKKLIHHHKLSKKLATMTIVQPQGRFGIVDVNKKNNLVENFSEKPKGDGSWINGGFFIFEPKIFDYLDAECVLEQKPLETLALEGQLMAYQHHGFWQPMDTYRETQELNQLWDKSAAPWKNW